MLSRSLIRIKAFKELYSRVATDNFSVQPSENEVVIACQKAKELYLQILLLPAALSKVAREKIAVEKTKFHPNALQIAELEIFASNLYSGLIENDEALQKECADKGLSWSAFTPYLRAMLSNIMGRDYLKKYAALQEPTLKDAVRLFKHIYKKEIIDNEPLKEALSLGCIWHTEDDLGCSLEYLVKNIDIYAKKGKVKIPQSFTDETLTSFAKKLVGSVLVHYDDYVALIEQHLPNWEIDRVVLSDMLIVAMAKAEADNFKATPKEVIINEYVALAGCYSTPKSAAFVNGVLTALLDTKKKLDKEN